MIPKILKHYINPSTQNLIKNYISDESYFYTKNKFILQNLRIGPFASRKNLTIVFSSLINRGLNFPNAEFFIENEGKGRYFYTVKFNSDLQINYDLSVDAKCFGIKFYIWLNLWYSTLEIVSDYIFQNKLFIKENKVNEFPAEKILKFFADNNLKIPINRAPTFSQLKAVFFEYHEAEEVLQQNFDKKNFAVVKNLVEKQKSKSCYLMNEVILDNLVKNNSINNSEDQEDNEIELFYKNGKKKKFQDICDEVMDLIDKLSVDPDLMKLIEGVNEISKSRGLNLFDKNDINVVLSAFELDKFSGAKKMMEDFKLILNFKLVQ